MQKCICQGDSCFIKAFIYNKRNSLFHLVIWKDKLVKFHKANTKGVMYDVIKKYSFSNQNNAYINSTTLLGFLSLLIQHFTVERLQNVFTWKEPN